MLGFPRLPRYATLLASVPFAALLLQTGCTCGSGPYQGDYYDGDRPGSMKGIKFQEGEKGDPKVVGCADGQREGFADLKAHPRIAGCVGEWEGSKSLRDAPTNKPCGDDGEKCAVPADLCAPGWHVCGLKGRAKDIADRASAKDCSNAGPGRFNAAMSHSPSDEIDPCPTVTKSTVFKCEKAGLGSEPVCCGNDCLPGKCKDGVWKDKTNISRGTSEGCGELTSDRNGGLMCCFDGDEDPGASIAADAKAGEGKAGDAKAAETKAGDAKAADAKKAGDAKAADVKADAKSVEGEKKVEAKAPAKKTG